MAALRLNTSSFQEALGGLSELAISRQGGIVGFPAPSFNRTGKGHFALSGMPPGLYALVGANLSNLGVAMSLPMLVTNDQITKESPDEIRTGDALKVTIRVLQGQKNISRIRRSPHF